MVFCRGFFALGGKDQLLEGFELLTLNRTLHGPMIGEVKRLHYPPISSVIRLDNSTSYELTRNQSRSEAFGVGWTLTLMTYNLR